MDVTIALMALLLLSPLLAAIAGYICAVSGRPVLFRQRRVGWGGEPFWILKFRTMRTSRPLAEHRAYMANLSRGETPARKPVESKDLIPGGRILRRYSLDELPQLWNVLRGEMSIVGPRPDVLEIADYEPWQLRRFEVLPGITGWWQVNGKNRLSFRRMIELDIEYVDRMSIRLDVQILARTFRVLMFSDNN